ncbi:MAG: alpha/beta hydrolase [Flavicella sp.]
MKIVLKITSIVSMLLAMKGSAQNEKYFSFTEVYEEMAKDTFHYKTKRFNSFDSIQIAYYEFKAKGTSIANLVFIHGGGANSKLGYLKLAKTLSETYNVTSYLMDLRGHGASAGRRGDTPSVRAVYEDISRLLKIVREKDKPLYLGGHSSGAGTVLNYSSQKGLAVVDGYLFVSPYLGDDVQTTRNDAVPFFEVDIPKFIANGQSGGVANLNDYAVFFNYPKEVLRANPTIVTALTVCMSNATTPYAATKKFKHISKPFGLFIGENDEIFDARKVLLFDTLPTHRNSKSISKIIPKEKHLSILNTIGVELGETITKWQAM